MKIYSDFKDYYDCGMRYGQSHIVYNRKRVEYGEKRVYGPDRIYLSFCGQVYLFDYLRTWEKRELEGIPVTYDGMTYHITPLIKHEFNTKYQSPIVLKHDWMYNRGTYTVVNPSLREFEFYKVFDPISAFQQIEMWIGANLTAEKPIPEIDDKTMRDIKGFDTYSFKKEKTT